MTTTITAALLTVRQATAERTHLAASSPALPGTSPGQLPTRALCGQPVDAQAPTVEAWDVDCGECVQLVGPYLDLPGWSTP